MFAVDGMVWHCTDGSMRQAEAHPCAPGALDACMACHTACVLAAAGSNPQAAVAAEARLLWQKAPLTRELLRGLTAHAWAHGPPACSEGAQRAAKLAALRVQAAAAVHELLEPERTLPLAKGSCLSLQMVVYNNSMVGTSA